MICAWDFLNLFGNSTHILVLFFRCTFSASQLLLNATSASSSQSDPMSASAVVANSSFEWITNFEGSVSLRADMQGQHLNFNFSIFLFCNLTLYSVSHTDLEQAACWTHR
jgi:hypothetical protein